MQFLGDFFIQNLFVLHIGEPTHGERWNAGGKEGEYDDFTFNTLQANNTEKVCCGPFPGNQKILPPFRDGGGYLIRRERLYIIR